jgi:hypothetical protein
MAMYLRQKDVEAAAFSWIQDSCTLSIDEVLLNTADSSVDQLEEVRVLLKEQQDEWKKVRCAIQLCHSNDFGSP